MVSEIKYRHHFSTVKIVIICVVMIVGRWWSTSSFSLNTPPFLKVAGLSLIFGSSSFSLELVIDAIRSLVLRINLVISIMSEQLTQKVVFMHISKKWMAFNDVISVKLLISLILVHKLLEIWCIRNQAFFFQCLWFLKFLTYKFR